MTGEKNDDTDNVFEKIFEKVKCFRKVFKYKYVLFRNYKYLKNSVYAEFFCGCVILCYKGNK